jgi:hypothetical protein
MRYTTALYRFCLIRYLAILSNITLEDLIATAHRYIIKHFIHNQILRSITMSSDELLANQQTILSNQITILSNQETILVNQEKLDRIFSNQDRILANQETILVNQEKLDRILSNQGLILAKLS